MPDKLKEIYGAPGVAQGLPTEALAGRATVQINAEHRRRQQAAIPWAIVPLDIIVLLLRFARAGLAYRV